MPRAHTLIERVDTPEGPLELRQSGESSFMITIAGRVLMTSQRTRSELAVAELACAVLAGRPAPRVLIGGLGLGFTLRAALDALPRKGTKVDVAELNPAVERWCRGPLAALTNGAVSDPRVRVVLGDVTALIREADGRPRYDAIVLDLYLGPTDLPRGRVDPLYGSEILELTAGALKPGGVYSVWSEEPNTRFEERLRKLGFKVDLVRPQGGGPRHAVYVAIKREPRTGAGKGRRAD
jgi:spermidine synthase